jgi:hypothetical protein
MRLLVVAVAILLTIQLVARSQVSDEGTKMSTTNPMRDATTKPAL